MCIPHTSKIASWEKQKKSSQFISAVQGDLPGVSTTGRKRVCSGNCCSREHYGAVVPYENCSNTGQKMYYISSVLCSHLTNFSPGHLRVSQICAYFDWWGTPSIFLCLI